jgi:hypothetical protein
VPQKILKSGICVADITDHLPIFCTVTEKVSTTVETRYFRDFTNFMEDLFLEDVSDENINCFACDDVNKSMNKLASILQNITDKHAPIRKIPYNKRRLMKNPWMSNAILISIKKRHKLFKSHFLSKTPIK